jgi:hypothetical protein
MHKLRKKRILALVMGTGLISIPLVLLWLDTPFFLQYWPFIPLILALIPGIVGGIVGAWMRGGSDHLWLCASGFGVLVWWTLLLVALIAFFIWFMVVIPPPSPGPETGYSGPQPGYGNGLLVGFVLIYTGAYAVVGLPFILLGTAITTPHRGVAY